ncbi:MAG: hypothetical protein QOJ32_1564 [Frankiaceae bacterium]|nr:hypothetical protein [Frankiaceae bacterium]MDQ1650655.1 hypothetical protein [Frankiaceae bacterium]
MLPQLLVTAHLIAVLFLTGLSWTVAVVVYPGFAQVGAGSTWTAFHAAHSRRMTLVVGPPWAVQGLAVAGLLLDRPDDVPLVWVLVAGVAGAATVLLTVFGAVPLHAQLGDGFDVGVHRRLERSHAWRTLAWTVAGVAAVVMQVLSA